LDVRTRRLWKQRISRT